MQLGSSTTQIPDGLLAAIALRNEKPHLGVPSKNPALHLGIDACNSTIMLGLQSTAALNRNRSRSTGKERDTESGNDYFGARYYNSATGRFLSPDWSAKVQPVPYAKLGDPQTLNLYAYVGNNPLNRTDPTGHYTISCGDGSKNCNQKELDLINKRISKDQTSKDPKVAAAAQAYGNLGDKGVAITVVDHVSAENGNIHGNTGAALGTPGFTVDATGKVTGVATAITLQAGLGTGDLARAVDHEGSHAEDRNTYVGALMKDPTIPADGEAEKSLNITHRESEVNAYTVNGYTPGDIQKTLSSPPYSTDTHIDEPEFPMPTSH